ncbi:hypothetical protein N8I77_006629 [Diaporthe amygdali]|uniref:Frequency clock protein n=1 Tax=Phomopsis amygdali TaxID=1214568 RepID=A0AAD9SJK2_PHOAM|nr:hypothetical protein N8I77_006629 [Diaporthe amygdali]
MADSEARAHGVQPGPPISDRGHPMPRRASPQGSVTLRHHRLARDASMKPETGSNAVSGSSPRRNSSGESHVTGQSDPKKWFDLSNSNAPAAFDHATMDVDPPFYQKQSDSSNEEMLPPARESAYLHVPTALQSQHFSRPTMGAQSSSAEDYRSVIDDLTIENKRLKEELKRYRQFGPELLRKDRLFEIKVHGLAGSKRRELESTLRDFAASLEGSPATSLQRKKSSKHASRLQGSSSNSKHASSSSSHSRPVDSAYASMSTGRSSTGANGASASLGRPSFGRTKSSTDHKVESYLQDIPEGLFPRPVAMTDKEKKKLVVRRLEQLFTGRMPGKHRFSRNKSLLSVQEPNPSAVVGPPPPQDSEPREARIELQGKMTSAENLSASNSNGENETGGARTGSGSGSNEHRGQDTSPQADELAEQRATRPRDLDPDRVQVPSENMQYIRHLGVTAPKDLEETRFRPQDVSIDAEGWIHLNLLCNLAQLHILNVTPSYIRAAISERSAKFQLSRDGRKIRWRGGVEGTKFSSDSSGDSSQRSPETDVTDGSNEDGQRKRQRKSESTSDPSSQAKLGPQNSTPSDGFHYKPLFLHNRSSSAETSMDETGSQASYGAAEHSNLNSRSTGFVSGSASSPRKKRRNDGAIIYYNGAPFCTDLSGDPGDISPTTYLASTQDQTSKNSGVESPGLTRTISGSSLPFRPLVDGPEYTDVDMDQEPELVNDDGELSDNEADFNFPWCSDPGTPQLRPLEPQLEPCGLGGVTPEDHFAILVVTQQPIKSSQRAPPPLVRLGSNETAESIWSRIAALTETSSHPTSRRPDHPPRVPVRVVAQRYKALKPLPLPPPAMFYPPFTETTESEDSGFEDGSEDEDDDSDVNMDSFEAISQRVNPKQSDQDFLVRGAPRSNSGDEDMGGLNPKIAPKASFAPGVRKMSHGSSRPGRSLIQGQDVHPDSSGATAGGEASGYSSSEEDEA